jgi:DNA-directed RNA polymerase specialized sigma24 family protein
LSKQSAVISAEVIDPPEVGGSVTQWIGPLKAGDELAAQAIWERYFDRLVRLAANRFRGAKRTATDEEDVALSAFHCLWRGATAGRFPEVANRDNLWRLLATIAAQKAVDERRLEQREKRGGGRTRTAADLGGEVMLALVADREPSPELAALLDDEFQNLLSRLDDESLRRIAIWKMEGEGNDEIARRIGCGLRTVERKLGVIRAILLTEGSE